MNLSVTNPIDRAIKRTSLVLFKPFNLGKWFVLGFCAFLAYGWSYSGGGSYSPPGGGGGTGPISPEATQWVKQNWDWVITVGLAIGCAIVGLTVLFMWLSSRGRFMFLDGVVYNRGEVVEPWKHFRDLGNSLFKFSLALHFGFAAFVGLVATIALAFPWPRYYVDALNGDIETGLVFALVLLLPTGFAFIMILLMLDDFVVPTMYLHDQRVLTAWDTVRSEVLTGRTGTIILFYLMRLVLGMATGVLGLIATCATCCLPVIPYIGTVILLPLFVFNRCYSLCFLEQLGPEWFFFERYQEEPPLCRTCGYNLTGNVTGVCPECGQRVGEWDSPVDP